MNGTTINAKVSRVVDGDTIRVILQGSDDDQALRILCLDTEESHAGGSKPVTPWGKQAKTRAEKFFSPGDKVDLEFPGTKDISTCLQKYRGNYGRLLTFVYKNGVDFQETMIREGYSPYFSKYGNARFNENHGRYQAAEKQAQADHIGVWDQNTVNGSEMRNYAALKTWWGLRAEIIDDYRAAGKNNDNLLNSRLDYQKIAQMARSGDDAVIFTEIRSIKRVGDRSAVISIGSQEQPFSLFLPDIESETGQRIVNLLESRYISGDETHPRRSYGYVSGKLSEYNEKPQIVIHALDQFHE